jgi:hypothetical protein
MWVAVCRLGVTVAAAALTLSACASPYDLRNQTAQHIDARTVRISSIGTPADKYDQVRNYALRRAAEETVSSGFDYFRILNVENQSKTSYSSGPGIGAGGFRGGGFYSLFLPGSTYAMTAPAESMMIRLYKEGEQPQDAQTFKAREVLAYMVPATSPKGKRAAETSPRAAPVAPVQPVDVAKQEAAPTPPGDRPCSYQPSSDPSVREC